MDSAFIAASFIGAYLLGSIPFGLIVTRLAGAGDIRAIGSGNIGATNVLRTGRKGLAAVTLVCDVLKGTAAVVVARYFAGLDAGAVAALGAFLGHLYPVWLKFKGGKGVATYIGVLLGLGWPAGVIYCACWLIVAALTRYSSLAGMVASAAPPIYFWATGELVRSALSLLFTAMLMFTHRANIGRLINGTESKIGSKTEPTGATVNPDAP